MPRPIRRKGSRNWYYRSAVPEDLRPILRSMPKEERPKGWGRADIWISLRTTDRDQAKVACARVTAEVEALKAAFRISASGSRRGPVQHLTPRQTAALVGEAYRGWTAEGGARYVAQHSEAEGRFKMLAPDDLEAEEEFITAEEWDAVLAYWGTLGGGDKEQPLGFLADRLLQSKGIARTDPRSRERLLTSLWRAMGEAFESRRRNAQGDYSDDPKAGRFPKWDAPKLSFESLVNGWQAERTPRKSTVEEFRAAFEALARFLGHDDASRVTADDMLRWKEHMLTEGRLAAKTINEKRLAVAKAVFGWGVRNRKLKANPATGISVKAKAAKQERSKGFTDQEAKTILKAALRAEGSDENISPKHKAARRWVPWLCCYSGARVAEIAQLRGADIKQEGGVWFMLLTPEAGSIKSDEYRKVPLHEHLVEMGFLAFVEKEGDGPLFYDPAKRRKDDPRKPPAQTVANKLAAWVRTSGVADKRVAPNHGWRHRFATECRRHGVSTDAEFALKGHAPGTVGGSYGDWPLEVLAREVAKLPRVHIPSG